MLSETQVRKHCEVSLGRGESLSELDKLKLYDGETEGLPGFTQSMARILYIHNGHASKLRIICPLVEAIPYSKVGADIEEEIKDTIDWQRLTGWINKHDDLTADNLVTPMEYSSYQFDHHKEGNIGRDDILDTIKNEVLNCNDIVLV